MLRKPNRLIPGLRWMGWAQPDQGEREPEFAVLCPRSQVWERKGNWEGCVGMKIPEGVSLEWRSWCSGNGGEVKERSFRLQVLFVSLNAPDHREEFHRRSLEAFRWRISTSICTSHPLRNVCSLRCGLSNATHPFWALAWHWLSWGHLQVCFESISSNQHLTCPVVTEKQIFLLMSPPGPHLDGAPAVEQASKRSLRGTAGRQGLAPILVSHPL